MGLVAATIAAPAVVALLVAPVAAVAAASVARHGNRMPARAAGVAAIGAAAVPLAALAGWAAALGVLALAAGAVALAGGRDPRVAASVAAPAAAAASLVLADHGSPGTALCLASAMCLFDMGNYLMGTGRDGGVLGAVSGAAGVGVLAVLAAAVIDPPFSGIRPWVVFGLIAALAPLGVILGRRIAGDARLPALRRLDSVLLAGPAWVLATHLLLR